PQPGQKILLTFREFDTECCYDYLKVYDGSSKQKRLGSFSGSTIPSTLISDTSAIVLEFFSDNYKTGGGSVIDFLITDCPGNCSAHGSCIGNQCSCDELYTGAACDIEICPEFCNNVTGNGQCSQSKGCECTGDFIGESCSFSLRDDVTTGSWHLIRDYSTVFRSRFAHAGVYVHNAFWIFGGFDLIEVFDDLVKFNFDEREWQLIQPIGDRP
ncbi:multiple epidermal growth factor-like domains 8, partial [Paramuricea clavata]